MLTSALFLLAIAQTDSHLRIDYVTQGVVKISPPAPGQPGQGTVEPVTYRTKVNLHEGLAFSETQSAVDFSPMLASAGGFVDLANVEYSGPVTQTWQPAPLRVIGTEPTAFTVQLDNGVARVGEVLVSTPKIRSKFRIRGGIVTTAGYGTAYMVKVSPLGNRRQMQVGCYEGEVHLFGPNPTPSEEPFLKIKAGETYMCDDANIPTAIDSFYWRKVSVTAID